MTVGDSPLNYLSDPSHPIYSSQSQLSSQPHSPLVASYASHNSLPVVARQNGPDEAVMNGPVSPHGRYTDSPTSLHSIGSRNNVTTVTKTVTTKEVMRIQSESGTGSPVPHENPYGTFGSRQQMVSGSPSGRGTPTRLNPHDLSYEYRAPSPRMDGYPPAPQGHIDHLDGSLPPQAYHPNSSFQDSFDQQYPNQRGQYEDPYRATPPHDPNNSYHSLPGDRQNGGDPYGDIPHMDDPHGYPAERGQDPYQDSRPPTQQENPYGRAPNPNDSARHTPTGQYADREDPYGSHLGLGNRVPSQQLYDPAHRTPSHQQLYDPDHPSVHDTSDPYARFDPQSFDPRYEDSQYAPAENSPYDTADGPSPHEPSPYEQSPYGAPHNENESPYGAIKSPYGPPETEDPYDQYSQRSPHSPPRSPNDRERENPYGDPIYSRGAPPQAPSEASRGPYEQNSRGPYGDDNDDPYAQHSQFLQNEPPSLRPSESQQLHAPPPGGDYDQHSNYSNSPGDKKWRNPELPEVIDYLSHPSNAIKANAAAYLQHLCYMDDATKAKARTLHGIPALVELVNNDIPEVHRAACGALRNLSYGKANDENKRAIKNAGGIPALVRLLRKSPDNDVRELVTGILWNLSSCQDLKKNIIDDGLAVLCTNVLIPHSGWERNVEEQKFPREIYWATVLRNATGVLRNISSAGEYARKKIRECEGLVDTLLYIVKSAIGKSDIDCKSVENCVCILRNLSYACQEVDDPSYVARRRAAKTPQKGENAGCFGGSSKKKKDPKAGSGTTQRPARTGGHVTGMELLWDPSVVFVYLPLLQDCSNPETLEAAAGALQNLSACDWQPADDVRAAIRKERGLPIIVELLTIEADSVVCAAATALRNLAIDIRNKELIGKYAMPQLVSKLPSEQKTSDFVVSDDTVTAVQATIYEVIKDNSGFAQQLLSEGGVHRLVYINSARGRFSPKVVKFASSILYTLWGFSELRAEYASKGLKQKDFISTTMAARGGPSPHDNNTLNRPRSDLGGPGVHVNNGAPNANRNTFVPPPPNAHVKKHEPNGRADYNHYSARPGNDSIPMNSMGPAPHPNLPSPGYTNDGHSPRQQPANYPPPGGVPLFPNLPPSSQHPQPQMDREPLYAQVNKQGRRPPHEGGGGDGGADSWV